jgi:hypothetical protein
VAHNAFRLAHAVRLRLCYLRPKADSAGKGGTDGGAATYPIENLFWGH